MGFIPYLKPCENGLDEIGSIEKAGEDFVATIFVALKSYLRKSI